MNGENEGTISPNYNLDINILKIRIFDGKYINNKRFYYNV